MEKSCGRCGMRTNSVGLQEQQKEFLLSTGIVIFIGCATNQEAEKNM